MQKLDLDLDGNLGHLRRNSIQVFRVGMWLYINVSKRSEESNREKSSVSSLCLTFAPCALQLLQK